MPGLTAAKAIGDTPMQRLQARFPLTHRFQHVPALHQCLTHNHFYSLTSSHGSILSA